ncbi:hypothetical protein GZ77_06510 [Endozoicomonas montiporae]|uniref:Uncharacterized protein n=2 Tax=Endozoicomonas montiporae TaxID=1027273 RepID=A0A081NCD2_9GAMM|nr:hypothetical protein EZMO1_2341 [Endozoicomonas montiporae CL-33]KEQ16105.1 hypothetical protein GZ77_06510 [Endozoicomonas montiporae]
MPKRNHIFMVFILIPGSLTENSLPYRQLLLRCSSSGIHAVVWSQEAVREQTALMRWQQIGLKIRFCSSNSLLFSSQNRIFILNFLRSSLRAALFSVRLLASVKKMVTRRYSWFFIQVNSFYRFLMSINEMNK